MARPNPDLDEAVSGADFPKEVEEEPHCKISHVSGENVIGAGDGDAAAAALGKIDVVEAGASGGNHAKGGQVGENGGGE